MAGKFSRALVALLATVVALHVVTPAEAAPAQPSGEPTTVMLYGDSLTHGSTGDWTWRYRLWQSLAATGTPVDLVGPRDDLVEYTTGLLRSHAYRDPGFDDDHASLSGMRFLDGPLQLPSLALTYRPDVVVAEIGFNDLRRGASISDLVAKWRTDIARVRAANPNVSIVLVRLPQTWFGFVPDYNDALARIAARANTPRSRVVVSDVPEYRIGMDTYDFVHPTASGERKLAVEIAEALGRIGVGDGTTSFADPAVGTAGWAPQPEATVSGTTVSVHWQAPTYATSENVIVRDVTWGVAGTLREVQGTSTSFTGYAGHTYRIVLAPVKGYSLLGTRSDAVEVTVPSS